MKLMDTDEGFFEPRVAEAISSLMGAVITLNGIAVKQAPGARGRAAAAQVQLLEIIEALSAELRSRMSAAISPISRQYGASEGGQNRSDGGR